MRWVLGLCLLTACASGGSKAVHPPARTTTIPEVRIETTQSFRDEGEIDRLEARVSELEQEVASLRSALERVPAPDPTIKRELERLKTVIGQEGIYGRGVLNCLTVILRNWDAASPPRCYLS